MAKADATIEATYSRPGHHPRLPRAARPDRRVGRERLDHRLGQHAGRHRRRRGAGRQLRGPAANVTVLTEVMGGGFGSKFGADVWGIAAAELAKKAGRPVKMFLDRVQEHLVAGNRPSATGHDQARGDQGRQDRRPDRRDPRHRRHQRRLDVPAARTSTASPTVRRAHTDVFVNGGNARAMRAPGHPQGCAIMEAAMDDLADKLGIDPLEFRLKNLRTERRRRSTGPRSTGAEVELGAELIGWERRKPRGQNGKGPIKRGLRHGPAPVGRRRRPGQAGHLHHQPRRLGRGPERHPGHRHRRPDDPGDHRRRGPRPGGRPTSRPTSATRPSRPARPRAARRPRRRWPRRASTPRPRPATSSSRRSRRGLNAEPEDLSPEGRQGPGQGRGEDVLEGRLPQARHDADHARPASSRAGLSSTGVGGCQFAEVTVDVETGRRPRQEDRRRPGHRA